jgi:hypothetical protein
MPTAHPEETHVFSMTLYAIAFAPSIELEVRHVHERGMRDCVTTPRCRERILELRSPGGDDLLDPGFLASRDVCGKVIISVERLPASSGVYEIEAKTGRNPCTYAEFGSGTGEAPAGLEPAYQVLQTCA